MFSPFDSTLVYDGWTDIRTDVELQYIMWRHSITW